VTSCCGCCDELLGSCATELVSQLVSYSVNCVVRIYGFRVMLRTNSDHFLKER
jgi:hypothetical protein